MLLRKTRSDYVSIHFASDAKFNFLNELFTLPVRIYFSRISLFFRFISPLVIFLSEIHQRFVAILTQIEQLTSL